MTASRRADAVQVVAGLVVAIAASAFVGFGGYFFIDEAALYGQLEALEEGGWTVPRPFPDRDPAAIHVPMARADVAGDEYAPFAKHPLHVVLARGAHLVGGEVGVRMLSTFGLVAAASAAGVIAGEDQMRRRSAFWLTLLATPLLFDSNLVVAHTLGAAVAAATFAVVVRVRRTPWALAGILVLACVGGLLRHEMLLLAGAGAVVFGLRGLRRRSPDDALLAAALLAGAATAYLVEPLVVRWAIGGSAGLEGAPTADSSLSDISMAAIRSLLTVDGSSATTVGLLALVVCGCLVATTAIVASGGDPDQAMATMCAVVSGAAAITFLLQPHLVRGLIWAFPAVLLLLAAVRSGRTVVPRDAWWLLLVFMVFAILVAATQYSQGGGLEWGWRYVAVGLPLVTPALAHVVADLHRRRGAGVPPTAFIAVLGACVVIQIGGLRYQSDIVSDTAHFLDRVDEVSEEADASWVLSTDSSFGRFAFALSVEGEVATASSGTAPKVLRWLADDRVPTVLLVWRFDDPPESLGGYRRTDRTWVIASGYQAALLELGRS